MSWQAVQERKLTAARHTCPSLRAPRALGPRRRRLKWSTLSTTTTTTKMPVISASLDAFLMTALVSNIPLYLFFHRRKPSPLESPYRLYFTALVLLHTTYILYVLFLQWPPNLFRRLEIPLTMPSESVRTILLQTAGLEGNASLPRPLETLLTRMSSFDIRTLYVRSCDNTQLLMNVVLTFACLYRFGQSVLQDCEHCTVYDDFAFYALPGPLMEYIREIALLGVLTITGSHRERWRTYAVAGMVCAAVLEGYTTIVQPVRIPRDGQGVFMVRQLGPFHIC